ncbi:MULTISPECIES: response regulator [Segatella]|uniref:Transcriptional regulatory protein ResD n=2 Tax=Segatella TaxID=2974251 RepID=D8DTQ6_9BACT|nr:MULTISPECIES: response regulator transcription factor [Segatella]EFI73116.1 transcriptional regulatory protein ResD [Segatella baroniae B14]UKK79471.1 response regulator transcription factor [Segatella baroniae B14]GJG29032.1 DNA-binding response regulator [Segatella bryantii]SER06265.1 DNA-binding response regulator, OmpR family, contains REC and winged-helix (wHTH) domain [Segatella baroniae B14]
MKDESYRILVVDDEEDLCEILKFNLEMEGYIVNTANSAEEALTLDIASYHLLLLDVMMGGMSGFALAKQLKSNATTASIPIVFLTAKDTENDTVTGFTLGADDYIAKPFSIREVILRIKAVLRRTAHQNAIDNQNTLLYKGIIINLDQKTITVDGQNVSFSKTEYELLKLLLEEKNRVFSRQQLIDRIWPSDVQVSDRTVDVNITRLRKKIGQYATHIATRQGFGYYFNA